MSKDNLYNIKNLIIVVLIIIILFFLTKGIFLSLFDKVEKIQSDIDNKKYHINSNGDHHIKKKTANHLASISSKIDNLVDYMVINNLPDKETALRLYNRWKNCLFRETALHETTAAYTVNKGTEMRLCVRNGNKLENLNTGMFVVLHELGHMMSVSYGHNEEFRNNFNYIVHLASALGHYEPQDFHNTPVEYCGVEINTSPCSGGTCEYTSIPTHEPVNINNIIPENKIIDNDNTNINVINTGTRGLIY